MFQSPDRRPALRRRARRAVSLAALLAGAPLLGGCQHVALMDPKGPIGADEKSIILIATGLMLIVVVPVILMTLAFAWRYRASNTEAVYAPEWDHSKRIELVVWLVPCLIILALGSGTWVWTHKLDPYRPIVAAAKPMEVDVVSLDWKWLFIYPALKIASVNELAMPVDVPVHFRLTSSSVMNAFFIPALGSQIYTMADMETQLSLMASKAGTYEGFSTNFSGDGFSGMHFAARAMTVADFSDWVKKVRASRNELTIAAYRKLERPSERVPVSYFRAVQPGVFTYALEGCPDGAMCGRGRMQLASAKEGALAAIPLRDASKPKGSR